jgi:hypothetical protein
MEQKYNTNLSYLVVSKPEVLQRAAGLRDLASPISENVANL